MFLAFVSISFTNGAAKICCYGQDNEHLSGTVASVLVIDGLSSSCHTTVEWSLFFLEIMEGNVARCHVDQIIFCHEVHVGTITTSRGLVWHCRKLSY